MPSSDNLSSFIIIAFVQGLPPCKSLATKSGEIKENPNAQQMQEIYSREKNAKKQTAKLNHIENRFDCINQSTSATSGQNMQESRRRKSR